MILDERAEEIRHQLESWGERLHGKNSRLALELDGWREASKGSTKADLGRSGGIGTAFRDFLVGLAPEPGGDRFGLLEDLENSAGADISREEQATRIRAFCDELRRRVRSAVGSIVTIGTVQEEVCLTRRQAFREPMQYHLPPDVEWPSDEGAISFLCISRGYQLDLEDEGGKPVQLILGRARLQVSEDSTP